MPVSLDDFLLLRRHRTVVDVRSEGEFQEGHIPGAVNIPVLNNDERRVVGITYKQSGQREAISEGLKLVGLRLNDIVAAAEAAANGNDLLVHCWRGGMRSANFCKIISMAGVGSTALEGGYKAYRGHALACFKSPYHVVLVAGYTGSGKTDLLRALAASGEQVLDLEALASHKGSAFGGLFMPPQPTTEQFQNELFEHLLQLDPSRTIWVEDESLSIGRIFLPVDFWNTMGTSQLIVLDVAKEHRVARLVAEYGGADPQAFLEIMGRIVKRLGGQHFKAACEKLKAGDMPAVMEILLTYYDKAYEQSIARRGAGIVCSLSWDGGETSGIVRELKSIEQKIRK